MRNGRTDGREIFRTLYEESFSYSKKKYLFLSLPILIKLKTGAQMFRVYFHPIEVTLNVTSQ